MRAAPQLPAPPTDRVAKIWLSLAGLLFAAGAALPPTWPFAIAAATFFWVGLRVRAAGRAAQRTHAALQALTRGQSDEAEAHLDAIDKRAGKRATIRRAAAYQRALIAFYRGSPAAAIDAIAPALTARTGLLTRNYERMQRTAGLSLRALALASIGEGERARADAAAVLASPAASPEALSRARLAEAVVLARGSDLDGLASHLRDHGALVLEHTLPRERILARAMRKMVLSRARSVYREAAKVETESEEVDAIGAWVARIAPEAAAFAGASSRLAATADATALPPASLEAKRAVAASRAARATKLRNRPLTRVLVLWASLVVMLLAIWNLLVDAGRDEDAIAPSSPGALSETLVFTFPAFVILFGGMMAFVIARARRVERELFAAQRAITLGDMAGAEPVLERLGKRTQGLGATQAFWMRARVLEQEARFEECLALCDRALGSLHAQAYGVRAAAALTLTPSILALRGVALAALGREGEANAELGNIAKDHAVFGHRAVGELRVRLIAAVRRGDLDAARAVAAERTPELPIPLRDETLADLVLALAPHGASRDEQERLDLDLRDQPRVAAWIGAIGPGLAEELARRVAGAGPRVAAAAPERPEREEEEEEEAGGEPDAGARDLARA